MTFAARPAVLVLALSSLAFAVLMPPEAYPAGKMGVVLCSTFAFLAAVSERKIPGPYLLGGILLFSFLLLHSLAVSVDTFRSLEFLVLIWAYYCLLGFFVYASFDSVTWFAWVTVLLAAVVSAYGIYQYFWGFDSLRSYIAYSVSEQADPVLNRIADRRVFSVFAVPGTLWGFLLAALPAHALLWRQHRLYDAVLVLSALALLAAGLMTRSFGFILGLFVLMVACRRRLHCNKAVAAVVILAIAGGLFYVARSGTIGASNPVTLRFKNWVSAWNIFALNPLGTGLNTYGIMYPQYMQPGANETQYAHNTPLQLISELGYPSILAAMSLVVFLVRAGASRIGGSRGFYLLLSLLAWLLHNTIDVNVYFASVGVLGPVLVGILLSRPQKQFETSGILAVAIAGLAVTCLVFSGTGLIAGELEHRARVENENGRPVDALQSLQAAKKFNPFNSMIFEDSGEIQLGLYLETQNTEYLDAATRSFLRAVELSPLKAGPHVGYALSLFYTGKTNAALKEIHDARRLFPSSERIQAIIRAMETPE